MTTKGIKTMRHIGYFTLSLSLLLGMGALQAETGQQIQQQYSKEAAATQPGFTASAKRGDAFFHQRFALNDKMPACVSCHTDNPRQAGKHAVTGKEIKPLAPQANAERLTDPAKVEKWFNRNCKEVVGRQCTPAEKADFLAFLNEAR
jgi:mono/diheme cytochrome c family protein